MGKKYRPTMAPELVKLWASYREDKAETARLKAEVEAERAKRAAEREARKS